VKTRVHAVVHSFLFGLLLLIAVMIETEPVHSQESLPHILILNSYHPGYLWSDDELTGVVSTLRQKYSYLLPAIEYLDTKHFPSSDHWFILKEYLARKYRSHPIDVIIVLDNPAFDLALKYRDELFPGVPIVFAGVNSFRPEMLHGQEHITGVVEQQDIAGTLKLALTLHPQTQQVWVIHDDIVSGVLTGPDLETLRLCKPDLPKIIFAPNLSFAALELQLRALPSDALVLLLAYVPDQKDQFLNHEKSLRWIPAISPVPVYTVHAVQLGYGIVGGMLLDGKEHGMQAATLALRVLAGEEASHIPIANSRSSPMFDDVQLRRFHIPVAALPAGSKIINQPPVSAYAQNWQVAQNLLAILIILILIIIVQSLRLRYARLQIAAMAFETQEGMMITNADRVILRVNQAFTDITGYSAEEVVGQTPRLLKSGRHDDTFYDALWADLQHNGVWRGDLWNQRKNGELYLEHLSITAVKRNSDTITHYVGTLTDITQRKAVEDDIQRLAFFDPLTGLPNRRLLLDRLHQALISSARSQRQGALLFIDLDRFKTLNDTLGHDIGDLLLQQVAQRLVACVREGDTVARLGGDEFVVMLKNLSTKSREAAARTQIVGEKILAALNQPYLLAGHSHHSTPSIGVTLISDHQNSIDDLLKRADLALYQAKAAGRNTLRFFEPQMQASLETRVALETELREALQSGQFVLYYQPQVDHAGHLTGAEALLRWRHPQRGLVLPAEFIPLAEETGLILPLGQWVLDTVCAQLAAWATQLDRTELGLVVNISARQFCQPLFVEQVLAALNRYDADPGKLKLELSESLLLDHVEDTIAKMAALKTKGVSFSLNDFGTGYSPLAYLRRLPLDQLKIDRSFVRDVLTDPNDAALAKTIVALAHSLGLAVIAEGVETEAQHDFLSRSGCHAFQGYLFGRPVPVEALL